VELSGKASQREMVAVFFALVIDAQEWLFLADSVETAKLHST
jgi:hypothetical protein